MIEPWSTPWSRFIYTRFHHEPFEPGAANWEFQPAGPLSGANGALPWIVFERDRASFAREFPTLRLLRVEPFMPFAYLLSDGVGMRSLAPGIAYRVTRWLEGALGPMQAACAMFALIVTEKA
jgi:hypothetical protein